MPRPAVAAAEMPAIACSLDGDGQRARMTERAGLLTVAGAGSPAADGVSLTVSAPSEAQERVSALSGG